MALDQFSRSAQRPWRVFLVCKAAACLALCAGMALPLAGWAAPPVSPAPAGQAYGRPDVQALIFPTAGGDMIDLTYPGVVPPLQAERDVTALLHAGGWHTTDVDISDEALPVQGRAPVPMTSVTFQTEGVTPAAGQATVRLEPWAVGLRIYRTLAVTYIMPPDFKFDGLRNYQDNHVQIALDQEQSTLTYHIRVLDGGNFSSLSLPLTQSSQMMEQAGGQSHRKLKLLGILVVGLVAAGVGYAVYTLLSRLH